MSAKTEKLLAQYRVYENLVRTAGFDPKTLEDSMDETKSNEMRMVRMFRNFLSHNQVPGFLEPTDKMLAFLDKEVQEWTMRGDVVKKHLKTPAAAVCEEKETCVSHQLGLSYSLEPVVYPSDLNRPASKGWPMWSSTIPPAIPSEPTAQTGTLSRATYIRSASPRQGDTSTW